MITLQQGTPGSGKSAVAVARSIAHLREGGVVAANFSLVDGWADVVSRQNIVNKFSPVRRYKSAASLHRRFFRVDTLDAILKIDPKTLSVGQHSQKLNSDGSPAFQEGQGLLILDEAQLIFNSRQWDKNSGWIHFFTQHRKLGWNVILIAHDIEMLDRQIRPLVEYNASFRNMQKVKIPFLGIPMAPFPMFLVITRYAGLGAGASQVAFRNMYPLPLWAAQLYDSCYLFGTNKESSIVPVLCGPPPSPPCGGGGGSPRPRLSSLSGPHWDQYLVTLNKI